MSGGSHPDLWVALLHFGVRMKENYLKNYDFNALMKSIETVTKNRQFPVHIENTALLVMDMQAFFTHEDAPAYVPSSDLIIDNLNHLIEKYKSVNRPVLLTRHVNNEHDAGMMSIFRYLLKEDDALSQIDSRIIKGDTVIMKNQFDAFHGTGLEQILHETGSTGIVITGLMTGRCIETTARQAFVRGFYSAVPADCTADFNRHVYESSVISMASSGISVIQSRSIQ